MCQNSIEVELDKRGGKNFGPPGGKKMTIFMDDLSMPEVMTTTTFKIQTIILKYSVTIVCLFKVLFGVSCRRAVMLKRNDKGQDGRKGMWGGKGGLV